MHSLAILSRIIKAKNKVLSWIGKETSRESEFGYVL